MKDKINFIDMNGKFNHEQIYNLIKTHSSKANKEISEKINIFRHNIDFFKFYSNKNVKNLLSIFDLKISENNDESFSSFKSDIEQYIYCISQIILSIKLFLKTQDILTKIIINVKNNLSKLKYENNLENYDQDYLFLYLESLFKISEKDLKFYPSASTLFSSFSPLENIQKNFLFQPFSSDNRIDHFANGAIEFIYDDDNSTPKFELKLDEEFENQEKKNSNLENLPIIQDSVLTLSKYVFVEESSISQNPESKLIKSITNNQNIKNSSDNGMPQTKNTNVPIIKRSVSHGVDPISKISKKNHYRNLLEMINKMYKKGFINSEEKLKLKKLVIEKSKKIEYLYYNIYKNLKKDKNIIAAEVKKIIG